MEREHLPDAMKAAYVEHLRQEVVRMRRKPRICDYSYFATRANLNLLKAAITEHRGAHAIRIVDIGCGRKPFRPLFPTECLYVGLDISRDESEADIIHDLRDALPITAASVDVVILSEVLEHLADPTGLLSDVARVLRPGGWAFVSTPFAFPLHSAPYDFYRFTEYYYAETARRLQLTITQLEVSNVSLIAPLLALNQLLVSMIGLPYRLKQALWLISNLIALPFERLGRSLLKRTRQDAGLARFLRGNPAGYAVCLQRDSSKHAS